MVRTLDLSLIRTFVAVADHGNMTVAANSLHLTQGAVSQHIRRLENQLGRVLFERSRCGVSLSPVGERLLGRARHLMTVNAEIWDEVGEGAIKGKLRLGVPPDLVGTSIAPALKLYSEAHPQVELSLICSGSKELMIALKKGELDLAIIEAPFSQTTGECLTVDRLVWVGNRGGNAFRRQPLPVSMVARTCAFRPVIMDALHKSKITWRIAFEAESIEATTATVCADLAITACLLSTVPANLSVLSNADLPDLGSFSISLHLAESQRNAATEEFVRLLRSTFSQPRRVA